MATRRSLPPSPPSTSEPTRAKRARISPANDDPDGEAAEQASKRSRPSPPQPPQPQPCYLLNLSDDVLLMIIKLVPSCVDVFRLSETCSRMARVCQDHSLWVNVDTRHANPLSLREFRKLLPFLHAKTKSLAIQGFLRSSTNMAARTKENLSPSQLSAIEKRCPNLEELILQDCFVDANKILINMLPETLRVLRITKCEFINTPDRHSYFRDMHERLPQLEVLDLSESAWVTNHSVMAFCKCENLKELNLRGCFKIGECFAYTALACRFGFKLVEKIDLRDTCVGDSELACFGRLPEVSHLYLGKSNAASSAAANPNNSGMTDRGMRSLCVHSGDGHISKLRHLSLANIPELSDAMLPLIGTSLPLLFLNVAGTKVTDEGLKKFVLLRPHCKVIKADGTRFA